MKAISHGRGALAGKLFVAASLLLCACTVIPTVPSVMALPGSRKSVEQYQADIAECQGYAYTIVSSAAGGTAAYADNQAASTAAAGAVLGAAAGAIIGAASGQAGQGAAIGAGTGLLFGGMAGSSYTSMSSYQLQRGYDSAYLQCMYARGNRVPMPRGYGARPSRPVYSNPNAAPAGYPPPNMPPPPGLASAAAPTGAVPKATSAYPPPPNLPPSSYPPPDAPPPSNLPPRN